MYLQKVWKSRLSAFDDKRKTYMKLKVYLEIITNELKILDFSNPINGYKSRKKVEKLGMLKKPR